MRTMIFATMLTTLPISSMAAELPNKPRHPQHEVKGNPCAAYGAGYIRIEGTATCVKIGGAVRVEAGRSK